MTERVVGAVFKERTPESVREILRLAADHLTAYMEEARIVDTGTMSLIRELDVMRGEVL